MLIECEDLDVNAGGRTLIRGLNFAARAGNLLAVLGPNGAGKTLLLHTLAGLRATARGLIKIHGRGMGEWQARDLARELALLPQNLEDPFPATVLETVLLGRHPHISRWRWESAEDVAIAQAAIDSVGLHGYEERDVFTLSGGERRRAAIAAVFAQTPRIFLMDEPTNHLDPSHQLEALQLLRDRADAGAAVIVTIHDANLASRFADQALLIEPEGRWAHGSIQDTLTAQSLSRLYSTSFASMEQAGRRIFYQS
jgi:iron complex transport system ATP-binding protein